MAGPVPFRKRRTPRTTGDEAPAPGPVEPYDALAPEPDGADARPSQRRRVPPAVRTVADGGRRLAHRTARGARTGATALAERLIETAPRIPVRDLATLRRHFPGLGPEEIADRLTTAAIKGSSAVGAGVGAAAMLPVPPAMTAELAAETLAVAAVEFKLIAELHEVYGLRAPGTARERAAAYLAEWAGERGIHLTRPSSVNTALSGQAKRELRQQILKRGARHLPVLTPFLVGAAVGALLNRRDTRKMAQRVRDDLRARQRPWPDDPAGPAPHEPPRGPHDGPDDAAPTGRP
ncbi:MULTISPECIES: hypothetical protein [Streptomycetaceae]|uniref:Uncharacterized protein n=1 Tax=Streptantibioticus cattleyicolor (strain ATCC 35852 / DSM 46488 / JCM 4925 / NBRC 14057 / NRRL 8057) TaxID=1003195 RepID=F8JVT5_STREN|nr:hypothetical protein [Streptantibioticus cattleyicolor]AEW96999.1 hypothetical protein SCATT_46280 [Streptantibioticus cattleyicolor NRRL 8057 = DSM 46488]MYS61465.1 hypothetical protein [Streptomyces sp. SID5468]CCB77323.1 conserved protein of unknown function [Streptantibioticus cattleyicolor NRRL 8057 = DSM 46488]